MSSTRKVTPLAAAAAPAVPSPSPTDADRRAAPRRLPTLANAATANHNRLSGAGLGLAALPPVSSTGAPKAENPSEFKPVQRADKAEASGFGALFVGAVKDAYREPDQILQHTVELEVGTASDMGTMDSNGDWWVSQTLTAPGGSVHAYVHVTSEQGREAGKYVAAHILKHIQAAEHFPLDLDKALQEGFFVTDDLFFRYARQLDPRDVSYASATVILAHGWELHIASVGTNRTYVIGQDAWADLVSADHRPHMNPAERDRLAKKRKKGVALQRPRRGNPFLGVFDCRCLNFTKKLVVTPGEITVTRAIGAVEARWERVGGVPGAVMAEPELWRHELDYENNFAVVIGSDTFWSYFPSVRLAFVIVIQASITWLKATGKRAMHARTMAAKKAADLAKGITKKYVSRPAPEVGMTRADYCAHVLMEFVNRFRHNKLCQCGKPPPRRAASCAVIIPPGIDRGMTSYPVLKRFRVPEPEPVYVTCCGVRCCQTQFKEEFPLEKWKAREAEIDKLARAALEKAKAAASGKYQAPTRMPLSKDLRQRLKVERAQRDKLDMKRLRKEQKRRGVRVDAGRKKGKGRPKDDDDDGGGVGRGLRGGMDELSSLSSSDSDTSSSDPTDVSDRWA